MDEDRFDILLKIMKASIEKHGSIVMTTGHFKNILSMVDKIHSAAEEEHEIFLNSIETSNQ
jgi:hypothetical protein